jgi:hypothetical protein
MHSTSKGTHTRTLGIVHRNPRLERPHVSRPQFRSQCQGAGTPRQLALQPEDPIAALTGQEVDHPAGPIALPADGVVVERERSRATVNPNLPVTARLVCAIIADGELDPVGAVSPQDGAGPGPLPQPLPLVRSLMATGVNATEDVGAVTQLPRAPDITNAKTARMGRRMSSSFGPSRHLLPPAVHLGDVSKGANSLPLPGRTATPRKSAGCTARILLGHWG